MWPFTKSNRSSNVLISIGSSHISGAYVHYTPNETPIVIYDVRLTYQAREGEDTSTAMLRALDEIGTALIEQGAPALRRETGSGSVNGVLISIASPWQETRVRTETIQPGKPFTFTRRLLSEAVASSSSVPEGRISFGESVIATILNGYDIPNAFGKEATRAEIVILSSTLEKSVIEEIRTKVRTLYHTHTITFAAFAPVAYSVLRDLYPHERDFLVLDVGSKSTDLAFVKGGLLVDVGTLTTGLSNLLAATRAAERMTIEEEATMLRQMSDDQPGYMNPDRNARFAIRAEAARDEWLQGLATLLRTFAQLHALPRTLFVLTQPEARDYLKRALDSHVLHSLWLSDEPLTVIAVSSPQFASKLRTRAESETPIFLAILALYQQKLLKTT